MNSPRQITREEFFAAVRKGLLVKDSPVSHTTGTVRVVHPATSKREELVLTDYAQAVPYLARNSNRNVVLVYSVGTSRTHYVGLDGCQLTTQTEDTVSFEQAFEPWPGKRPVDFARSYLGTLEARKMIPISGSAFRVLRAILHEQVVDLDDVPQLSDMENAMTETTKRSPDGPVAMIHAYLDKKVDAIRAQTVSRKELIEQLEEKGYNHSTIVTQCGIWARTNGVTFARPTQAAEAKKATAATKRAAKKAKAS